MKLQSVELELPQADQACEFLRTIWRIRLVERRGKTEFLGGRGSDPYLLAVTEAEAPAVRSVTFSGSAAEVEAIAQRANAAGITCERAALDEPHGGDALIIRGPEDQTYRFRALSNPRAARGPSPAMDEDTPVQLTHVVINTIDLPACEHFATDVLGFHISDRTRIMTFVRCNRKHHCVAYAPAALPSLNHIAFEVVDVDAVMRGIGRMRDAGIACSWGPGRHGPGDNVFAYFIAPFGAVIEYTSEVSEVDDSYRVGNPQDWTWPPGRIDQWGVSQKDVPNIVAAERRFRFISSPR